MVINKLKYILGDIYTDVNSGQTVLSSFFSHLIVQNNSKQ